MRGAGESLPLPVPHPLYKRSQKHNIIKEFSLSYIYVVNKVAVIRLFVFGFGWHPWGGGSDSAIRQDPILVCHVSRGLLFK
jgi:hypothetical protein